MEQLKTGKVWLVGAGTGDLGLFSIKGMEVLQEAEVVVYDALVSLEVLAYLPKEAEWINVGKRSNNHLVPQEEINQILLRKAKEGKRVVRLKGGDPFVFGRGGEELELLSKEGIPFEIVPGITSSIAVPAYNGIPVTHRDYTSSFHVITGHKKQNGVLDINFKALVQLNATLVFLMGVSALETICNSLIEAGMDSDMPAAILERGTTFGQRRAVATVGTLKEEADKAAIKSPAVIVIGKVCALEQSFAWIEEKPLFGKQILITRPREKASHLAKRLRKLGAQVVEMPSIDTIPVSKLKDSKLQEEFEEAVDRFSKENGKVCAVFTSPQGVKHFFGQLKEQRVDMRNLLFNSKMTFAVIGNGTRKALEEYNLFADYMPEEYSADALGKLLKKTLVSGTKVFIFRALQGSPALTEHLEEVGLTYEDVAVYKTVYEQADGLTEKIEQAFNDQEMSYVTFTSASTVQGFVKTLEHIDYTKVNAICIGEQTANEARKYGMQVSVSKEATMDSMIELLMGLKE